MSGSDRALRVPLIVGLATLVAVLAWLGVRDPEDRVWGNLGGTVVLSAAAFACLRVSRQAAALPPVRGFWVLWSFSAAALVPSTIAAMVRGATGVPGMPVYEAVPTLISLTLAMLAFRHVPLVSRTRLDWARLMLDGLAVTAAGAVFFGYVVLNTVPETTAVATQIAAAVVGVGCLLALVVFGKAAVSPEGRVDPVALAVLANAPLVGLIAVVLFLGGTEMGMLLLSVLGYPLVGMAMCVAAHRQSRVLDVQPPRRPRWSIADPLQFVAVTGTAVLVIVVSARDLDMRGRAVIGGAVLIAAVMVVRQLLTLRENTLALRAIRRQQAELERLALTDNLTGLPNRTGFTIALTERLDHGRPATVLLIDIDDFKMVNDTLGPAAADQLLRQVAERLQQSADGDRECVARFGGDEFAVLLPSGDPAGIESAAARFQHTVGRPVQTGEQQFLLHASVGVVIAEPGETADEVLRNADIAMYAAKESGKASWTRFEPRMRQDMVKHARLAGELHDALRGGELRLLYQPVYDLVTGRMHGCEALVRWQHPERGFVSPGDFIPVAERSGLIVPLGAWVLREACTQLARWQERLGDQAVEAVNVNVAVRQLREAGFVDEVAAVLSETGLTPRNLILEVTESSVVDGPRVAEALQDLHEMGVRLALDDFGTGQSSLSLLRAFPVDVLKLDKSFVDGIADGADRGRLAVAAAVAQLVEHLDLKAVAEGIETLAQLERLRDMGYRYGQGYLMAKPLPADECGDRMAAAPLVLGAAHR
ncbi:EAL domain-containing protein [Actinoplanes sp. NPDC049802]|uniref:putative bifunctional diguanylate cyclase/phosphodiesterase n=1 Tax=Actinoplanes sp. NPDC049802 TaxID=3154742 RepID=UPI0033C7F1B1